MTQHSGSARHGPSRAGQAAQAAGFPTAGLSFSAPLTTSLVPAFAAGSGTPTYSRATTAYVQDHEGVQRCVLSNEARFWGARRVHNVITTGTAAVGTGWTGANGTTRATQVTGPDGNQYGQIVCSGAADQQWLAPACTNVSGAAMAGRQFTFSITLWTDASQLNQTTNDVRLYIYDGLTFSVNSQLVTLTATPTRYNFTALFPAGTTSATITCRFDPWDTVNTPPAGQYLYAGNAMLEEVTGQSVTTPSLYIGGNTSLGAGVNGVQYLDTVRLHTQNFWPNSANIGSVGSTPSGVSIFGSGASSTVTIGASTVINGIATQICQLRRDGAGGAQGALASNASNGSTFRSGFNASFGLWLRRPSGVVSPTNGIKIGDTTFIASPTTIINEAALNALPADTWTFFSGTVPVIPASTGIAIYGDAGAVGAGCDIALVHVTYNTPSAIQPSTTTYNATAANTVNNGTDTGTTQQIPATTLLGYLAEAAGTQLVTPTASIRDLTDASWTKTTMTVAKTSTGVDGVANSATRCTASGALATALQAAPVTAAGNYTTSFYIRRVTGTGNIDITVDGGTTWSTISGSINSATYTRVQVTGNLALNTARIGLRIATNGDAVDVDFAQLEGFAVGQIAAATSPMASAGAARNVDDLRFVAANNVLASVGAAYCEFQVPGTTVAGTNVYPVSVPGLGGVVIGIGATGPYLYDGTTFADSGVSLAGSTSYRAASAWGGTTESCVRNGATSLGIAKAFDGDMTMGATMTLGGQSSVNCVGAPMRNVRIYSQKLTDAQLTAMVA